MTDPETLFDEDLTDWAKDLLRPLYERYMKRAKDVWCGRNRVVFDLGNIVVKLPRHAFGFDDNEWEGSLSNIPGGSPKEIQYARTRMAYHKGVPVVFMEKVKYTSRRKLPDWVMSVDGGQVGYNKRGRLVAFDYGYR